jgi:hypothetical protein
MLLFLFLFFFLFFLHLEGELAAEFNFPLQRSKWEALGSGLGCSGEL